MATRMANRDVINTFVQDGPRDDFDHRGYGNVAATDTRLYSYGAVIAEWDTDTGTLVVNAGWDGYSPTTSKHMKFLYDAVVGESDTYGYRREDYDAETGYADARAGVALHVTDEGKGSGKPRWNLATPPGVDQ